MAVSRWERGVAEPTGETYIRLGNLAEAPLCWFFWKRAGLRLSDVTRVLPEANRRFAENRVFDVQLVKRRQQEEASLSARSIWLRSRFFPCTPELPACRAIPRSHRHFAGIGVGRPRDWCPNPVSTVCLRVKGNSMSPLILDGYIIAVDTSATENDDLVGQIVVAWHREQGLLVSRMIRFDHMDALVSDRREYEAVSITAGSDWRIVGKVLWWTGRAR